MSGGGGVPPLSDDPGGGASNYDADMSDATTGESDVFARRGKLLRSPVLSQVAANRSTVQATPESAGLGLNMLFTPEPKNSRTPSGSSKTGEVRRKVEELYQFVKSKNNVHTKIKELVTGIKSGMLGVEREQQALKAKIEEVEKQLKEKTALYSEVLVTPREQSTSRAGKRDRDTPGEEEVSKKQKEDSDESEESDSEGSDWQLAQKKNEKKLGKKREEGKKEERKKEEKDKAKKKKGEKKKEEREKENKKKEEKKIEEKKTPRQRSKGDALIIEVKGGSTYADLLRKVRADPQLKELGESVVKTRRTQRGEMLFELKKDPAVKSAAFKQLVEKSLGEEANVRALSQETVVECRDLDEITTADELQSALKSQCGLDENASMVIRMRKAYGGTQTAAIRLSTAAANKLLEKGKVRVGWSYCQLKAAPRVTKQMERCFKCMGFGHHARNCEGPDRSKLCRKCGGEGHFANDCANSAKCMLCNVQDGNGHVTGGFKCPEYKKAMASQQ